MCIRDSAEAMRDDVAKALGECPALSGVLVLSPDAAVRRWGTDRGFAVLDDGGVGLNGALALGLCNLADRGCERAVIIPSDVPLLSTEDLALLAAPGGDVRLARDQHGAGTNGLALPLPGAFTPRFGHIIPHGLCEAGPLLAGKAGRKPAFRRLRRLHGKQCPGHGGLLAWWWRFEGPPSEPSKPIQEAGGAKRLGAEGRAEAEGVLRQRNLIFQT